MNPITQTAFTESNPRSFRQTSHQGCPTRPEEYLRKQEVDEVFEARLRWFLSLSAAAGAFKGPIMSADRCPSPVLNNSYGRQSCRRNSKAKSPW